MIKVQGISHYFGKLCVLDDVWFDVPKGAVLGFIGPNGAGKTTTLRMITTLLEPQQGRILVDGHDVVEDPAAVRKIMGFMPDDFGVYDRVTVSEYLEFFSAAYNIPIEARAKNMDAVMELTDLGPLRDRLVAAMSKGMKQRLAIARTLLHDPKILILDEPANGLDPRARIEMRDLIEQLQSLGKTIVLSSHILTELSDMVSSVVILEKGKVLVSGSVDKINSKLRPERAVKLRLLDYPDGCEKSLLHVPGVLLAERGADGMLRVNYTGGDATVAVIVKEAVERGLQVIGLEQERDDLEHIFLEMTKGELQ